MPQVNLDKDSYDPNEVYELIRQNLGEEAATQFKLYFNKIQKVPPHKITYHENPSNYDSDIHEYRFSFGEFASKLGIPPEIVEFSIVKSNRHGGGAADNMGWIRLKFRDLNGVKIAIADEIQSDFAQRASRLRLIYLGKMPENKLLGWERDAWEKIKNNPGLITQAAPQPGTGEQAPRAPKTVAGPNRILYLTDNGNGTYTIKDSQHNSSYDAESSGDAQEYFRVFVRQLQEELTSHPTSETAIKPRIDDAKFLATQFQEEPSPQAPKQMAYQPTALLKSSINKIESTTYSDILNYLFNKTLGFSKAKGAEFLFIPSAKMMLDLWKSYAKEGAEDLYRRVYDENAKQYGGAQEAIPHDLDKQFYIIDLKKVPDIKMARVTLCRFDDSLDILNLLLEDTIELCKLK